MPDKNVFIGSLFLIWGAVSIIKPSIIINFRRWVAKNIFGAEYKTSKKTEKIQRIIGVGFIVVALIITDII